MEGFNYEKEEPILIKTLNERFAHAKTGRLEYMGKESSQISPSISNVNGQDFKAVNVLMNDGDTLVGWNAHCIDDKGTMDVHLIIKRANGDVEKILAERYNG